MSSISDGSCSFQNKKICRVDQLRIAGTPCVGRVRQTALVLTGVDLKSALETLRLQCLAARATFFVS